MAKRDPAFNEFLRNFKEKNEQNWAQIIDLTQAQQEEELLAKSPEYRRNEMVMLEEFRRRKNLKDYHEIMKEKNRENAELMGQKSDHSEFDRMKEYQMYNGTGPERYFERKKDECFDPNDFTLIFLSSDSVTNVTRLNRVNHRRVLMFIGNA